MEDGRTTEIMRRLKSVEGHVRGIERMVDDDAYCVDIVNQIHAVQAALRKVSGLVLDRHLNTCVIHAIRGNDSPAKDRVLAELMDLFEASGKA